MLLGAWHLFEISHASSTVKTSRHVVKSEFSKNLCDGEECKEFCVKIIAWSVVVKQITNTLIFLIFEYGAECSAESGAK